jgi:2'-5' RNA ligase
LETFHLSEFRLFIALNFSQQVLDKITHALEELKEYFQQPGLRWVATDKIHLTLKFLGNVPHSRLPEIYSAIQKTAIKSMSCQVSLSHLGAFPSIKNPNVIWIGVKPDDALLQLAKILEINFEAINFPAEARGFSPHITLARVSRNTSLLERQGIAAQLSQIDLAPLGQDVFSEIYLFKSEFHQGSYVYTILRTEKLVAQ